MRVGDHWQLAAVGCVPGVVGLAAVVMALVGLGWWLAQ